MQFFISKIRMSGIKCIDTPIELEFCNRRINSSFVVSGNNVKAIYGENGTGKSAIINAIEIYRNLMIMPDYLSQKSTQEDLLNLIHKKSRQFQFCVEFIMLDQTGPIKRYSHEICISFNDKTNRYELKKECLCQYNRYYSSNERILLKAEDGALQRDGLSESCFENLQKLTMNLLDMQSFMITILKLNMDQLNRKSGTINDLNPDWTDFFGFIAGLSIYTEQSDRHMNNHFKIGDLSKSYEEVLRMDQQFELNVEMDRVPKKSLSQYEKQIAETEQFIKLFKPSLKRIDLKKTEDRDSYYIDKIFVYPEYKISLEYESTGIKKLVKLYSYLDAVGKGGIVFIDDFDANLNDIYLSRLIEYVLNYCPGQLCFTAHNAGPMDILQRQSHSLDFISRDGMIVPWIKNGNYKARKMYTSGYIQSIPFNVTPESFLGVFGEKGK
ncbi:MAG: ATP-binding protein [Solobacterium sp.]|nr:ATP-binding protein [Solobacterium sp.]